MKILIRDYNGKQYVWVTAKYNGNKFVVNNEVIEYWNVVSVINDNRKNYIKCSSCGEIFPKKSKKFEKHKREAETNIPCLKCRKLRTEECSVAQRKFIENADGTYTMVEETQVRLNCRYSSWSSYPIDTLDAKMRCERRQCGNANATEISDIFTELPGVFDHIVTIDKILDNGYERIGYVDSCATEYILDSHLGIKAYVNRLGIVDSFAIDENFDTTILWYSKKYNRLFTEREGKYIEYCADQSNTTLKYIAKFYK